MGRYLVLVSRRILAIVALVLGLGLFAHFASEAAGPLRADGSSLPPPPCIVTQSDGSVTPDVGDSSFDGGYGNTALWTNLHMWDGDERVPVPPSHVQPDGALGPMKWAWYRFVPGHLTIEGSRLDAPAPPLQAWVPDGYGQLGFQVTGLTFPTEGCWQVTGRLGDQRLTFVTYVLRVDGSGKPIPAAKSANASSSPPRIGGWDRPCVG